MKRILFFAFSLMLCSACQKSTGPAAQHPLVTPNLLVQSASPRDLLKINSLAIFPPEVDARVQHAAGWPSTIFERLDQAAQEQLDLDLSPSKNVRTILTSRKTQSPLAVSDLLKLGKQAGADGVLQTKLLRFVQREGSAVGASTPAGIDFTMSLLRVTDGKSIWEASYHFQDAALTDNLFRVKERLNKGHGPGWRSADDLLDGGFRSAFEDLSAKRQAQFSGH